MTRRTTRPSERSSAGCSGRGSSAPTLPAWLRARARRRRPRGRRAVLAQPRRRRPSAPRSRPSSRGIRPGLVVGIDEEGGNVTRLEAATGSSLPGRGAARLRRRPGCHDRGRPRAGRALARGRRERGARARRRREHRPAQPGDRRALLRRRARGRLAARRGAPCAASSRRARRRAPSTSPATATPTSTPTSRCRPLAIAARRDRADAPAAVPRRDRRGRGRRA